MKKAMYLFILIATMGLTVMLTACEKKGPAENAGEQIDQAMEKTEETLDEAKENMQDMMEPQGPMEAAGEKIDKAVEDTKEMVEESVK